MIFFSLSIGFGIMITYASYLTPRTNLTNTGLVTAFATVDYMAAQQGVAVDEVAASSARCSWPA